jgi:hypothetical protein
MATEVYTGKLDKFFGMGFVLLDGERVLIAQRDALDPTGEAVGRNRPLPRRLIRGETIVLALVDYTPGKMKASFWKPAQAGNQIGPQLRSAAVVHFLPF